MNSTTLRGVFPDPKPVHKKNFVKENVLHIKRMQGLVSEPALPKNDKYQTLPPKPAMQLNVPLTRNKNSFVGATHQVQSSTIAKVQNTASKNLRYKKETQERPELDLRRTRVVNKSEQNLCNEELKYNEARSTHRGVQTERTDDLTKLYESGVIKYPSPSVLKALGNKKSPKKCSPDHGDSLATNEEFENEAQSLNMTEKHDYVKENVMAIKQKSSKLEAPVDKTKAPPTYQKGVVPKYLRDRKDEESKDLSADSDCPEGHVLLPEEERKETLRVLRQSYADRIQELNSMPVRSDTLRMRKRKMELEEELKKIDEGIKVFQRPKVFVKINA